MAAQCPAHSSGCWHSQVCAEDGSEEAYKCILSGVLPQLALLVADTQPEVRIAAGETLVGVAKWVRGSDLGARVLTIVLRLAHDDEQEDLRMTAAVLLNELAEVLGPDLCHQFVAPEIISLAEDPIFRVRKAAALNMDAVCRTAGQEAAGNRLLPVFLRLAQDDIWGVRKACAESIMGVSKGLHPSVRVSELIPLFERFVGDSSQWVREAALQHLGPFISTLPSEAVKPALLAHFTGMASPNPQWNKEGANTMSTYCAFSFPAVVATLGPERWGELRDLFLTLCKDPARRVRKPMAHALHELARILGAKVADSELVPIFELYLQDVDHVKVGVLANLAPFLAGLSPGMRESFLPVLDDVEISSSSLNWRFRLIMAQQLQELSVLFSPAATFSVVRRLALRLLGDAIHEVRLEAAARLAPLLVRCHEADPAWMVDFVKELLALGQAETYRPRLVLAHVLRHLSRTWDQGMFIEHMLPAAEALAQDKVHNVRLVVAQWLSEAEADAAAGSGACAADPASQAAAHEAEGAGGPAEHAAGDSSGNAEAGAEGSSPAVHGPLAAGRHVVKHNPTGWLLEQAKLVAALEALRKDKDAEVRRAAIARKPAVSEKSGPAAEAAPSEPEAAHVPAEEDCTHQAAQQPEASDST